METPEPPDPIADATTTVQTFLAAAWVVSTLVVLGTAIFSVSRAGLSVCQHATLARLPARSMIAGLCVVVAATHVVGADGATALSLAQRSGQPALCRLLDSEGIYLGA